MRKNIFFVLILSLFFSSLINVTSSNYASAATNLVGYFTGAKPASFSGDGVLGEDWKMGQCQGTDQNCSRCFGSGNCLNSIDKFYSFLVRLLDNTQQEKYAGSYLIQKAIDRQANASNTLITASNTSELSELRRRLETYSPGSPGYQSGCGVRWNVNFTYTENSMYGRPPGGSLDVYEYNLPTETAQSIVFYCGGTNDYIIKRKCGNAIGKTKSLRKAIPRWDLQGITWPQGSAKPAYDNRNRIVQEVDMSNVNADRPVIFNHEIRNMSGDPATFTFYTQGCYDPNGNIANCNFSGTGRTYNPFSEKNTVGLGTNLSAGRLIGPFSDNTTTISRNAPNGSIYCQRVVYRDQDGPGGPSNELVAGLSSCFRVKKNVQFTLQPTGSIQLDDDESPAQATYNYCVKLTNANVSTIGASISVRLYKNGGVISTNPNNASITVNSPQYCVNNQSYNVTGLALTAGDRICIATFVTPTSNSNPATTSSDQSCDTVVNKPVFRAFNGSISAGQCSNNGGGYLASWYNNNTSLQLSQYKGSATNLATLARKETVGLASAKGNSTLYGSNVLTFAKNTSPTKDQDKDSPLLGEAFSAVPCLKDASQSSSSTALTSSSLDWNSILANEDRQYTFKGSLNIPQNNAYNKKASIFVEGDVYISGNIVYANSGSWAQASDIPKLIIRAKGNIYISGSVTQLNGLYIAKPKDSTTGGSIYTCANVGTNTTSGGVGYTAAQLWDNCGGKSPLTPSNSLTVYGVFIADKINLLRTAGSLRSAVDIDGAAERFYLSPEIYLNGTNLYTNSSSSGVLPYDAIYNLPPVL